MIASNYIERLKKIHECCLMILKTNKRIFSFEKTIFLINNTNVYLPMDNIFSPTIIEVIDFLSHGDG